MGLCCWADAASGSWGSLQAVCSYAVQCHVACWAEDHAMSGAGQGLWFSVICMSSFCRWLLTCLSCWQAGSSHQPYGDRECRIEVAGIGSVQHANVHAGSLAAKGSRVGCIARGSGSLLTQEASKADHTILYSSVLRKLGFLLASGQLLVGITVLSLVHCVTVCRRPRCCHEASQHTATMSRQQHCWLVGCHML